ncbi:hypothetical protein GMDG_04871 [Pseudogymnoascus destructans 20631-21]|uniref:Uncharacterized protein n=1 Tax=Pseudogymnoascus destructans (strain ATCC MYA-4855 / 20631-21) TaxID=658429 RepID=L8GCR7_PSED2|nr:hypothetical protein GMDG_04871 [Pseudogymnoascus destructans 20631-21]
MVIYAILGSARARLGNLPLRATPPASYLTRHHRSPLIHPAHVRASVVAVARVSLHRIHDRHVSTPHSSPNIMISSIPLPLSPSYPQPQAFPPRPGLIYVAHPLVSPTSIYKPRHKAC